MAVICAGAERPQEPPLFADQEMGMPGQRSRAPRGILEPDMETLRTGYWMA